MGNTDNGQHRSKGAATGAGADKTEQDMADMAADQLSYAADLVLELKGISERLGAGTLATILGLAHAEAQQELRRRGR